MSPQNVNLTQEYASFLGEYNETNSCLPIATFIDYPINKSPTGATLGINLRWQCTEQSKSRDRNRLVWCISGRFSRSKTDGQTDPPDHRRGSMQRRSRHVVTGQAKHGQEFPVR